MSARSRFTVVSFHAHPDDEAMLTSGTLARAAAAGHRVVIVVATAGESGLADVTLTADGSLGDRRRAELDESAAAIGAARVEVLGYGDSGYDGDHVTSGQSFARADAGVAADRLAAILREERADVLTIYDRFGGYGHADHVQVHRVGLLAAESAGTRVVLEATVDRTLISRAVTVLRSIRWALPGLELPDAYRLNEVYAGRAEITHRVDVTPFLDAKRRSLAAHASQATSGVRTLAILLRLPKPLFRLALGREWFVEQGRAPSTPPLDDIFASLR